MRFRQALRATRSPRGLADMQRTGSIGALERAREDYLLSLVRPYRHDIASVQRLVGYLLARDREARAVRDDRNGQAQRP